VVEPIAVLVVDDSVVIRRIVTSVLSEDDGIRVVGTAASGRSALEKIEQLAPDILTLDIEMPEMDGLETLRHLRQLHPRLPAALDTIRSQLLPRIKALVPRRPPIAGSRRRRATRAGQPPAGRDRPARDPDDRLVDRRSRRAGDHRPRPARRPAGPGRHRPAHAADLHTGVRTAAGQAG
jgi:CheY-like chemotaxis protein